MYSFCLTSQSGNIEFSYERSKQKSRNKKAHYTNGNKNNQKNNKNKKKKYLKILQINKGKSNIQLHLDLIKIQIQKEDPAIVIITESQIKKNEINLHTHFENYKIGNKFLRGLEKARVTMLIKKTIRLCKNE